MADPINPDQLYSQAETAGFLGCSGWTLQAHRKKNMGLAYVKIESRVRYLGRDIQEYIDVHRVVPAKSKANKPVKKTPAVVQNARSIPPHLRRMRGFH